MSVITRRARHALPWAWGSGIYSSAAAATDSIHYQEVHPPSDDGGAAGPVHTACVIHGLLGQGKNLRTFTQRLCKRAEEDSGARWRAILVDQRNHGKSGHLRHLHPPHNLQSSARDLIQLFTRHFHGSGPSVVIGHSMGGKVALELVRQLAAAPPGSLAMPQQVWVLDAKPGLVDPQHSGTARDVGRVLHAVRQVPVPVPSRQWLVQWLHEQGFSQGITQWLASNLVLEAKDRYGWAFNVDGAISMFDAYCKSDYFPLLRAPPAGVTINIVRAAKSDRWDTHALQAIQEAVAATAQPSPGRGTTRFWELPNAGHWVHVDNESGLVDMIAPSMAEVSLQ